MVAQRQCGSHTCLRPCAADGDAAAEPPDWLVSVVTGEVALPVDTYILGGYGEGCVQCANCRRSFQGAHAA